MLSFFPRNSILPRLALLYVATFWGLSWLGFRHLYGWGMSGMGVGVAVSVAATAFGWWFARTTLRAELARVSPWALLSLAVCAAFSNLGFTWGMVHGEVMRVMLLFYLMPMWTGLLATLVFGERTNWAGWTGIAMGLVGAVVMLYNPAQGLPLPANAAEWSGLIAGVASALLNVQVRHISKLSAEVQAFVYGLGAVAVGLVWLQFEHGTHLPRAGTVVPAVLLIVLMGGLLCLSYRMYQFGVRRLTSHQAVVIFPFELIVGAVSSALLAHEVMTARAWIGGGLIVLASLISGWWGQKE